MFLILENITVLLERFKALLRHLNIWTTLGITPSLKSLLEALKGFYGAFCALYWNIPFRIITLLSYCCYEARKSSLNIIADWPRGLMQNDSHPFPLPCNSKISPQQIIPSRYTGRYTWNHSTVHIPADTIPPPYDESFYIIGHVSSR